MTDTLPGEHESIVARRPEAVPARGLFTTVRRKSASGYISNYTSLAGFIASGDQG
jgi:hypothetical protein